MNWLLKITEGPNKGAEIALPQGVAVTLGKSDSCDIVLADRTLPADPVEIIASESGVSAGGEALEPFHVKTLGATSFAVGPADAPWGALVHPAAAEPASAPAPAAKPSAPEPARNEDSAGDEKQARRRRGCGCALAAAVLALVAAVIIWFLLYGGAAGARAEAGAPGEASGAEGAPASGIEGVASRYGLSIKKTERGETLSGNMKTRRERLAATGEAYAAAPGIELDLSDDESLRTAAEDALFTLTEGALSVVSASNRAVSISGRAASPGALNRTIAALRADLPKLESVDAEAVAFDGLDDTAGDGERSGAGPAAERRAAAKKPAAAPPLPLCGILMNPRPYLILRDGRRIFEGAEMGGATVEKITADSVTVKTADGTFEVRP